MFKIRKTLIMQWEYFQNEEEIVFKIKKYMITCENVRIVFKMRKNLIMQWAFSSRFGII